MTWKPDICIYHGNCDDGFGAAHVIRNRWPECKFLPGQYNKPTFKSRDEYQGCHLLFVDFSFKRAQTRDLTRTFADVGGANSVVILDHHKTAQAELEEWNVGPVGEITPENIGDLIHDAWNRYGAPIVAMFDMGHSGAVMAWQFAMRKESQVPFSLKLIEDRDLWKKDYSETERFSAALRTYPQDFAVWDELMPNPAGLIADGAAVLRGHKKLVDQICAERFDMTISGHKVPCCNASYHYASDVAHELLQRNPEAPFAVCWFKRADGKFQFSLRSDDAREDVSAIAKAYGGGGHRNAAGFEAVDIMEPMTPLLDR